MGKMRDYIKHDENKILGFFGEYRWLSNYHLIDIKHEGITYPSTEHAYQASKTKDKKIRKRFLNLTCAESQKMGQQIDKINNWDDIKLQVMLSVLIEKFRDKELRKKLLNTGNKHLEETNHWGDKYWGVCNGEGENNLGKLLMVIRAGLK